MFRYEVGATILVERYENPDYEPMKVEILSKAPHMIEVKVLSGSWFSIGDIRILTDDVWFSIGRMK